MSDIKIKMTSDIDQSSSHIASLSEIDSVYLTSFIDTINPDSITAHIIQYNLN